MPKTPTPEEYKLTSQQKYLLTIFQLQKTQAQIKDYEKTKIKVEK